MELFYEYLEDQNRALKKQAEELAAADRTDEANLTKVRANIYEVCETVCKTLLGRPDKGIDAFRAQLANFKLLWGAEKEKASGHGATQKAVIEEIKLDALHDITSRFEEACK